MPNIAENYYNILGRLHPLRAIRQRRPWRRWPARLPRS